MGTLRINIFIRLLCILIITCACSDQNKETDEGNQNTDAATGGDGDADSDSDTDTDADADVDAGSDSGTDAGEKCDPDYDGNCHGSLKCYCEHHPELCRDTIEKARKRAENDVIEDGGVEPYTICLRYCTGGGGELLSTDGSHGSIRYYSSSTGKCTGTYIWSDVPEFCNDTSNDLIIGEGINCEFECQAGVDCDPEYPECD